MKKFLSLLFLTLLLPACGNAGGGTHTGYVTAVEETGWIMTVNKAYFKTDVSSSQEDVYCFDDNHDLKMMLEAMMASGQKVELTFHTEAVSAPWRCDEGDTFIDDVQILN